MDLTAPQEVITAANPPEAYKNNGAGLLGVIEVISQRLTCGVIAEEPHLSQIRLKRTGRGCT